MSQHHDNQLSAVAEKVVRDLLEGVSSVMEDRLDDILAKYGQIIPGSTPEAKRQTLETWQQFDPSRNKKYFRWMVDQFVKKNTKWTERDLDLTRDTLMDFEHFITMPAFQAPRDIQQYDLEKLVDTVQANKNLVSKADMKRGRKTTASNVISSHQDMELLGFKDGASTAAECWRAYSAENPNWDGKPHTPQDSEYNQGSEPYSVDHLWCTRNPERGAGYIRGTPSKTFYIVRKGGWPLCAAVLSDSGSQVMDLHNRSISVGVAEKIYPLFRPVLDEYAKNRWSIGPAASGLFDQIRIVRGEIKPGETIKGANLTGSSLKALPDDLTVSGNLNVSATHIQRLPNNLKVQGDLDISNTTISELPPGLEVAGGLNIAGTRIVVLPPGMTIGTLDISNTKIAALPENLKIKSRLKMQGTPIVQLPKTLVLEKGSQVEYSAPLTKEEIKRYFFWMRFAELRVTFMTSRKTVAGARSKQDVEQWNALTPEQHEAAWQEFYPKLMAHFQKDATVDKAITSLFKPVNPSR